jgi:hypothetical protein
MGKGILGVENAEEPGKSSCCRDLITRKVGWYELQVE